MLRSINLSALLAVTCWATMAPFAKYAFDSFPADAYLGLCPAFAALGGFVFLTAQRKSIGIDRDSLPRFLLARVDRIMVYQYLPAVMTLAIAVVAFGERITWAQAGGSVLILVGVAIVQRGERHSSIEPA